MIQTMRNNSSLFNLWLSLGAAIVLSLALPTPGKAAPDYGAETIAPERESKKLAVPVDQVEEPITGATQPVPGTEKQAEKQISKHAKAEIPGAQGEIGENPQSDDSGEAASATEDPVNLQETTTLLNVKDAEIETLLKLFSKLTKRNYIIDSNVKGKITIYLTNPVTVEEGLRILDSVLLLKGFTTVPVGNNVWKVVPAKDAKQTTIPTIDGKALNSSDQLVTHLVRLKFVKASDLQQLLSQFVSKDGIINSFSGTNSLILIDSQANITRLRTLIEDLDVSPRDQEITIIPIQHAEAKNIAETVKEILSEKEDGASSRNSNMRAAIKPASATKTSGQSVEAGRALPLKIIPDERTNALIVVADSDMTTKVKALVEQLDSALDLSGGRFYVYKLKHADAEKLADVLNGVISGDGSSSSGDSSATNSKIGSSLSRINRENRQLAQTSAAERISQALRARSNTGSSGDGDKKGRVNFEGEVSVTADTATNTLIINASRTDYNRLKTLIDELDVKRRQVLVEATIVEVSLDKAKGAGIELQGTTALAEGGAFANTNWGGFANLLSSDPTALTDLTIAAAGTGSLTLPGGLTLPSQAVLVKALSQNSNANVLSAPTILTTDNEEAQIIVGQNVPFVTSTSTDTTNLGNTFNQVERQDVGIKLVITPQISAGDYVSLRMFVEISNIQPGTANDEKGPTTTIRTAETSVEVKSDQMIVTGGLISDSINSASRGVPYLEDIPVLGAIFRRDDDSQRQTNLVIFLTPRIIRDQYEARDNTIRMRDDLEGAISKLGDGPNRSEVLRSQNIDNVVESLAAPKALPSTITPPNTSTAANLPQEARVALDRTNERLKVLSGTTATVDEPASHKLTLKNTNSKSPDEEVIELKVKPKLPSLPGPKSYVVLRTLGQSSRTVGVKFSSSKNIFQVGAKYRLTQSGTEEIMVCLGIFANQAEASQIAADLLTEDAYRELSPQELINFGSGPWYQS
ncbi:type II secretion system secretin GspD [bacterium]|nr:type II secretion system secretin GspD [bacterium]